MTEYKEKKDAEQAEQDFLEKWKKQFEIDRQSKADIDRDFDLYEEYYQGKRYFGNLKELGISAQRDVRTVVNFVRMMIEALIDLSVPEPDLRAVSPDDENAMQLLNKYMHYVSHSDNDLEEINLENERRVKKFGGAFYKVHWNNAIKYGQYVGDIEISNPHPKYIIPNAGAINWKDDLEHYHLVSNRTIKYIRRRWPDVTKDELEDKAFLYKEYDKLNEEGPRNEGITSESNLNRYSIVETTFRDEDGDICKLWWSGDLLLEYIPKFYWHRDEDGEPTRVGYLEPGTQIRMGTDPETDEPMFRTVEAQIDPETGEPLLDAEGFPIGEEVEYYIPTCWDIVYQPYLPKDMSCWGTSMIDDIADLYESILKAVHIQEEGFLRGRKKITTDNDEDAQKIMDPGSEVIVVRGQVGNIDLNTNIDGIMWIEKLKEWMQLITGATNAAMGVHDPGVKSGRQAELYVSQANFKASLASTYKAIAFKQLYQIVADFALAFCDDDRPFRLDGESRNKTEYGTFSRLSMLRDDSGNIIYPNWDVSVSAQAGWMQNKSEIMNNIVMLANNKSFDPTPGNLMYLKILQKLGIPYLDSVLEDMEREIKKQEELQQQQMELQRMQVQNNQAAQGGGLDINSVISRLPPELQQEFSQIPPEQQQALLAEIGG